MSTSVTIPQADFDTTPPLPAAPSPGREGETIAGYRIHPFASRLPLIEGPRFEELVESIQEMGIDVPIELNEGLVTDGRNRLRAVEVLRDRGIDVEVRTVEWQPRDGRSVEEHIFARNMVRRHLTDDQRAVLATDLLPIIRAQRAARQAATRFQPASASETTADPAAQESAPPAHRPPSVPRSSREKDAASTVGQIAGLASVTRHKAAQAVGLADDIAAGLVPEEERDAVLQGKKPLRSAGLKKPHRTPAKKKPVERSSLDDLFDSAGGEDEAPAVTHEDFIARWERLKAAYAVTEHRELRVIALQHIADEQRRFDQC